MDKRTRQRDEVLHDRAVAQTLDLDGLKADACDAELACDSVHVRTRGREHRDGAHGIELQRFLHDFKNEPRLDRRISVHERMDLHAAARVRRRRRRSGCS